MVYAKDLLIPPTGEPVDAARLVVWTVKPGEAFREGDILFEMETDKSVIEIPAPQDGVMLEHLVQVDGLLSSDTAVARIEVQGEAPVESAAASIAAPASAPPSTSTGAPAAASKAASKPASVAASAPPKTAATAPPIAAVANTSREASSSGAASHAAHDRHFATPSARRIARERGVSIADIVGTGPQGRVTQSDLLRQVGAASQTPAPNANRPSSGGGAGRSDGLVATPHGDIYVRTWTPRAPRDVPTVVLIHGIFGDTDTWAGTISALTRAGVPVMALDLPCHGKTPCKVSAFAQIVEAVCAAIVASTNGAISLVGHSFGAAIAARLSVSPALNVSALTLIAPVGLGTDINQSFLNGMLHAGNAESLGRELGKLTHANIPLSPDYLADLQARLADRYEPIKALCQDLSREGVQQVSIAPDLDKVNCPVTLIHGRQDAIIPWQHALNAPAKVALHLVPGSGHMPQWEASSLTNDLIVQAVVR